MKISSQYEKTVSHDELLIERNRKWTEDKLQVIDHHLQPKSNFDKTVDDRISITADKACVIFSHAMAFNKPYTGHALPLEYEIEEMTFKSRFNWLLKIFTGISYE